MEFEAAEEIALLLATGLIYCESQLRKAMDALPLQFSKFTDQQTYKLQIDSTDLLPDPFPFAYRSRAKTPLSSRRQPDDLTDKALRLTRLFPWDGISKSVENGFFGTSVSLRSDEGYCVRMYCNTKGEDFISSSHFSALADRPFSFPLGEIEVALVDPPEFAQNKGVPGGSSISAQAGIEVGTLGGWLRDNKEQYVGISNNHVAADLNSFWAGEPQISPGNTGQIFGYLIDAVPLRVDNPNHRIPNLADVAWLKYKDRTYLDTSINGIDPVPTGEEDLVDNFNSKGIQTPIWMCGQKSRVVQGKVVAIAARVFFHGARDYYFEDQIELDIGQPGDSGSLVLTQDGNRVGGLFFAAMKDQRTGKYRGFANPWDDVKSASGLDFIYK